MLDADDLEAEYEKERKLQHFDVGHESKKKETKTLKMRVNMHILT